MQRFLNKTLIVAVFLSSFLTAQQKDTTKTYILSPIEVTAERSVIAETNIDLSKERLSGIFESNGFSLIRKGVFFAQDIYTDGLKRSDVNVVVDGERYHTACPNRMDSPLTRVNPIELESVDLIKTTGNLLSGIGGVVNFHRRVPSEKPSFQTGISGNTASQNSVDASLKFEGYSHMATFRYSTGMPYKDADGRSFKELYGYDDNFKYALAEGSFQGKQNNFRYGGAFTYTQDVSFPYLMMDERMNKVFSAFFSFRNNKIYFNYTDHLMDNAMRKSQMTMTTAAKNITVGVVGNFYEVYYRNWDASNNFIKRADGNLIIENNLMPNTKTISAAIHHKLTFKYFRLSGKLGILNQSMNDKKSQSYYGNYENIDNFNRWFPIFGINIDYTNSINNSIGYGFVLEGASEAPDLEELYISVNKPKMKPNWFGNPNLDETFTAGIRGMLAYDYLTFEVYYSQIWNYVNLSKTMLGKPTQTYKNIDAQLIGINFSFISKFADLNFSYTYGQNLTNNSPLSEIRPFEATLTIRSPKFWNMLLLSTITFEAQQTRVDPLLSESTTPAWYKADVGIRYKLNHIKINLMIENVTNQLYYRHLSYLRNPFTSGFDVFEPGRNIYLSFNYSI